MTFAHSWTGTKRVNTKAMVKTTQNTCQGQRKARKLEKVGGWQITKREKEEGKGRKEKERKEEGRKEKGRKERGRKEEEREDEEKGREKEEEEGGPRKQVPCQGCQWVWLLQGSLATL